MGIIMAMSMNLMITLNWTVSSIYRLATSTTAILTTTITIATNTATTTSTTKTNVKPKRDERDFDNFLKFIDGL